MVRTLRARISGRMQRKAEEDQTPHFFELGRMICGGLRSHAASHRFASRQDGQVRRGLTSCSHRGTNRRFEDRRRVRDSAPLLHVGELIPKRRDFDARQFGRELSEKRVVHTRTSAMRQHEQPADTNRP